MSATAAIGGGLVGACALTALHESARRVLPHPPRMDILGMRSIAATAAAVGADPPRHLHAAALAGDLVSNALYYSLVGAGRPETAVARGAALGLLAGVGAVLLPGPLGLGTAPSCRTPQTAAMTVAWYTAGGLAAGLACRLLGRSG
jgi:hypothetical protein